MGVSDFQAKVGGVKTSSSNRNMLLLWAFSELGPDLLKSVQTDPEYLFQTELKPKKCSDSKAKYS